MNVKGVNEIVSRVGLADGVIDRDEYDPVEDCVRLHDDLVYVDTRLPVEYGLTDVVLQLGCECRVDVAKDQFRDLAAVVRHHDAFAQRSREQDVQALMNVPFVADEIDAVSQTREGGRETPARAEKRFLQVLHRYYSSSDHDGGPAGEDRAAVSRFVAQACGRQS